MEKLNELMSKACLASEMGKKGITVDLQMLSQIRDEFWAVEKRAEAAEHERDCHMDIAEHFKARCKEMEQQKPYGYVHNLVDPPGGGVAASIFKEESRHYGRPLFTRPAPAINLADLVPVYQQHFYGSWHDCDKGEYDCTEDGSRRVLYMRNIEEAK